MLEFARSYKRFGLNVNENGDLVYREWAPAAKGISLVNNLFRLIMKISLEISIIGTERAIGAKGMILGFGLL